MPYFLDYVKVGLMSELLKKGWLKAVIQGRDLMITISDDDLIAFETGSALDERGGPALPPEFHPETSDNLNLLLDDVDEEWTELRVYPVKIDGDNIFIGINLLD